MPFLAEDAAMADRAGGDDRPRALRPTGPSQFIVQKEAALRTRTRFRPTLSRDHPPAPGARLGFGRRIVLVSVSALAFLTLSPPGSAQQEAPASPYLPLGHWAYPIVDSWIARGWAPHLSPVVRPLRRFDVARALSSVDLENVGPGEAGWFPALRREFAMELALIQDEIEPRDVLKGRVTVGGGLHSQSHPDLLRPEVEGTFSRSRLLERSALEVDGAMGNVVGGVRVVRDGLLRYEPRFPDGRAIYGEGDAFLTQLDLRMEEAYVEIQGRRARISFGRQYRNWGAADTPGLLRSGEAYSFDELGYRLGSDRIFLTGTFTSLRDLPGDTARYHAAHRLEVRLRDNLTIGVSEASLHGGPGGRLDLRLISPVAIWELTRDGERDEQSNLLAELDIWWRPSSSVALFGAILADSPPGVGACCEAGGTLGLELPALLPDFGLRAQVTAIESLMYRTSRNWEEYSYQGIGLGWDQADVVLASVEATWRPRGGVLLRPRIDVQVRGEEAAFQGRLRPSRGGMEDFPNLMSGQRESTLRPSLSGLWRHGQAWIVQADWNVGVNRIRHFAHQAGDHRTEPVGWFRISVETPRLGPRSSSTP